MMKIQKNLPHISSLGPVCFLFFMNEDGFIISSIKFSSAIKMPNVQSTFKPDLYLYLHDVRACAA